MAVPTSQEVHQTPLIDEDPSHDDPAVPVDKVDCERGVIDEEVLPMFSHPITTCQCYRWLRFASILSLFLLVHHFWPFPSLLQGWGGESVICLDDLCPQVEALTPPRHEALLGSLDEEFGSSEFKLKAYKSLGGAVRIP